MSLAENINTSQLKSFSILGLFGFKDIKIPFEKEATILIAENGSGKTTILNTLYYSISCKFHKLSLIDFDSIILEFVSGDRVEIRKDDFKVSDLSRRDLFYLVDRLRGAATEREIEAINGDVRRLSLKQLFEQVIDLYQEYGLTIPEKFETLLDEKSKREIIQKNLGEFVLYFPTYRRIEEDLKNLGYSEERFERLRFDDNKFDDNKLIQFGMDDVRNQFDKLINDIKNSALTIFSKVTGDMLTQFLGDLEIDEDMRTSIQPETLKIVLSRVGEKNISISNRQRIENLVQSGEIFDDNYKQLVYFLSKLISLYAQQKEKDELIKKFAEICNKYLNKKSIIYDEANVNIYINQSMTNTPIPLGSLSSGEKQIISLFSKIYLELSENFILLFDEPELSLSIEWQRLLLPDILKSGKCKLLLAVTHSPFIFDNELDLNAHDLESFSL
jgi:predicted ATP-binding protein involved in virulence